jgi:hypothetical protein
MCCVWDLIVSEGTTGAHTLTSSPPQLRHWFIPTEGKNFFTKKKEATSQLMNRWGISDSRCVIYLITVGCIISEGVPYTTSAYYPYISWWLDFICDTPCLDAGTRISSIKTPHRNTDTIK